MILQAEGLSDIGQRRTSNQDNFLVDVPRGLFIVSDGMGGEQAGEIAAKAVVTVLPQMLEPHLQRLAVAPRRVVELTLRELVAQFSQRLRQDAADQPGLRGMGATLELVWICKEQAHLVHMGDSRVYRLRRDRLSLLTEDHSVVALLLKHGDITPQDAVDHPARGQLSRYVGIDGEVYPDVFTVPLHPGERFLLCSDGLWGMVPDREIARLLLQHAELAAACRALVDAANQAGGRDNITVVIVEGK
jgi:protein phosphatase